MAFYGLTQISISPGMLNRDGYAGYIQIKPSYSFNYNSARDYDDKALKKKYDQVVQLV